MVSSLAEQLAKGASQNAILLNEKTRKQAASESYLFPPKQARQHDLDSLHALGVNGFLQLKLLQPQVAQYEHALFSEHAKAIDRTLQPAEQNAQLDSTLAAFLPLLGPFLLDAPTGKVLEWLVRRFRIHEFNVEQIVTLFLPYHETPHFTKMVSILHIPNGSPLRFLEAYKMTVTPLHRPLLLKEMLSKPEVARLVTKILPSVLKDCSAGLHRALIAFHTGVLLEYIAKCKALDENAMALLLPAAMEPLESASAEDSPGKPALLHELILGSYLVLAAISQKTHLTSKAVKSMLAAIMGTASRVSSKQLVRTLVSVCATQDQLDKLPASVVKGLLAIPDIEVELVGATAWMGAERFMNPLVNSLITRIDNVAASAILESFLTSPALPPGTARSAAVSLMRQLTEGDTAADSALELRSLLSQLHQRHPDAVQTASQAIIDEDGDKRDAVEQLVMSISMPVPGPSSGDSETTTLLVGASSGDAAVRAKAVRDLLTRAADENLPESEKQSIAALPVLQALYSNSPEVTTRLFISSEPSSDTYLDSLKQALHDVIRAHLTFLLSHYLPAASASLQSDDEPRRVVMDTAVADTGVILELLGGPGAGSKNKDDKDSIDLGVMTKINVAVAAKVADNILASNYFHADFGALLDKLHDENPHGRALAYLITRALLNRLTGEQRIEAGHRVLRSMKLDTLEGMGDFMKGVEDVGNFLSDASVGTAIVSKPSSQNTLHRLQVSVLSVLPNFPRPSGVTLEWLSEHSSDMTNTAPTDDVRAVRYIQLLRAVYCLSNSSASLPLLSTHLLRTLFMNLGDDALAFLAGVWLTADEDHIQYAALRHACAFLEAHVATQRTVDFQTVLPAMLVMLQSADAGVRDGAVRCIAVVIKLSYSQEAESVYAFDEIYGSDSAKLQYLDWADFQKYMQVIAENRDNLLHDPDFYRRFTASISRTTRGSRRRSQGVYKQRVLCYLLSHVNGCPLLKVKIALLKSVDNVSNEAKAQVLLPTIETLEAQDISDVTHRKQVQELATLTVSSFDASSAGDLNNTDKPAWGVYEKVLDLTLKNDIWEHARTALLHRLEHGLFAKLNAERKFQLCQKLIHVGAENESSGLICKKALGSLLTDVPLINRLLVSLQPQATPDTAAQPATKRARMDKTVLTASNTELPSLAVLAEVLGSVKVAGSLELVACLLETLHKVVNNVSPDASDRRFIEQLLMSAIENAVENFVPSTPVAPGAIRVDTLVEILRASENPQTFHQACLLLASLARVAPDAVLHNVMPIFTFMGSNVFHRDDTYSFRVVQKTIDSIVPAMVSALKEAHGSGTDLHHASREFLRVFTNAAKHVPRHRRVNFFSHLVDTLGPADFLAPVTMLLVDRASNRVVRQNAAESAGSLFLPLAVCERYSADLQLSSFVDITKEVGRLVLNENTSIHPFLEDESDEDQAHADVASKRRATALLVFCDHALKRLRTTALKHTETERTTSRQLLASLLTYSAVKPDDESFVEIAAAARSAMASTLGVMSAPDFVAGVLTILESGTANVQAGALELLSERLTEVAEKARAALSSSINKVVGTIRDILSAAKDSPLAQSALHALTAVCNTLAQGEEGSVSSTVPLILQCLAMPPIRVTAFQTILSFSSKLGPRLIPHMKDIVKACVQYSREAMTSGPDDPALVSTASNILRNLLTSIPTFWGETELSSVVELYLDSSKASASDSAEMSLLIKTTAKRASPNVLLPTLCSMWTRLVSVTAKEQLSRTLAYVQVVKISVKAASRPAVLENLRELFKTFLSMFDFSASGENSEVESTMISAFMEVVVKLNETAFRPIFRKMFDWAFAEGTSESVKRKVVFCHVYASLLDFFKALMVPYMSFAWPAFSEHLRKHAPDSPDDGQVWLCILHTLAQSMSADEDRVFWRSDKLRQLVPIAVQQIPIAPRLNLSDAKAAVSDCLVSLLGLIDDDVVAKSLNMDVLMHSRSEDARVRLFSLSCAEQLWRAHGDKLLGFVAETATFVAEAAEDENDRVVQEAHKLKAAVESIGGNIDVA
ncbi:armadillo-type protein [Cerioporus squamosus]|nr:armadillo-type protein [Cerioporus squamosus]